MYYSILLRERDSAGVDELKPNICGNFVDWARSGGASCCADYTMEGIVHVATPSRDHMTTSRKLRDNGHIMCTSMHITLFLSFCTRQQTYNTRQQTYNVYNVYNTMYAIQHTISL